MERSIVQVIQAGQLAPQSQPGRIMLVLFYISPAFANPYKNNPFPDELPAFLADTEVCDPWFLLLFNQPAFVEAGINKET